VTTPPPPCADATSVFVYGDHPAISADPNGHAPRSLLFVGQQIQCFELAPPEISKYRAIRLDFAAAREREIDEPQRNRSLSTASGAMASHRCYSLMRNVIVHFEPSFPSNS
jgi:hypothetical protein